VSEAALPIPTSRRAGLRRARRLAGWAVTIALVALWIVFLRPTFLGGPASYVLVSGTSMQPTLHGGDLVLAAKKPSYEQGDVIVYKIPEGEPGAGALVIHRVIGVTAAGGYITQGDNRETRDPWQPTATEVQGKMRLHLPRVGLAFAFLQTTMGLALIAGLITFFIARSTKDEPRGDSDS
jgi:signal peptidase